MKPGIRTTELWIAVLTDIGVVAAALAGNLPPTWAAVAAGISSGAYAISRGLAKNGTQGTSAQ